MLSDCKKEKLNFVNEISAAIVKVQRNVEKISYEVFEEPEHGWQQEWLTIAYDGGAMTNISVYGSSCSVILEEIAKYTRHGNYSNNDTYLKCANTWKKVC